MLTLLNADAALLGWSRAQFALTAGYHWLFVPLTLGLAVVMGIMETLYVVKKDEFWKRTAQFWQKLFGINFAIGVATGIILEFEFGTNWSNYSWFVGDIFGAPLAIEGIVAFFMEATFIAVMFFGWNKVGKKFHLSATWLTGIGATLSAWWILVANSWMQHPVGMAFNPDTVRNEMMDFFGVAFQSVAVVKFFHSVLSGWMTGGFFTIGVSCWYLLKKRHTQFALSSLRVGVVVAALGTIGTMLTGDGSGIDAAQYQPMKLAAAEGLEHGGEGAPFSVVPGIEVPKVLSILATHDPDGFVPGIEDIKAGYTLPDGTVVPSAEEKIQRGKQALAAFKNYREARAAGDTVAAQAARAELDANIQYFGYGYLEAADDLVPPVPLVYWAFRVMVGFGSALVLVLLLVVWFDYKKKLSQLRWMHYLGIAAIPMVYLAGQAGWIVAEVGRQPWAIQDLLPVNAAISSLSVGAVMTTFFLFLALFTILLIVEIRIMCKAIKKGPELEVKTAVEA
ncbi:MAG: cytochrome ubiquinol oxidase subunit I [Bacteroidaceae bacterium]|nr:cytochrome ubiquinol oxidase subunit I [Bacteroidaceae bacterium]